MEYTAGDSVALASHGVGKVKRIETRVIGGRKTSFYVIRTSRGHTLMVPVNGSERYGLRSPSSPEQAEEVLSALRGHDHVFERTKNYANGPWIEKFRWGDLVGIATILKNIMAASRRRDLTYGEQTLAQKAYDFLVEDLSENIPDAAAKVQEASGYVPSSGGVS